MKAACPSLQWKISGVIPKTFNALIPPTPNNNSCFNLFSKSPPYK